MTVRVRKEVQKILIKRLSTRHPRIRQPIGTSRICRPIGTYHATQMTVRVRMEEVQKILIGPPRIRQPIETYQHR